MGRNLIANANRSYVFIVRGFEKLKWEDGENAVILSNLDKEIINSENFAQAMAKYHGYYICMLDSYSKLFAIKSEIKSEPHPLIDLCEAAVWYPCENDVGCWIVGVDYKKNCYFSVYP